MFAACSLTSRTAGFCCKTRDPDSVFETQREVSSSLSEFCGRQVKALSDSVAALQDWLSHLGDSPPAGHILLKSPAAEQEVGVICK